MNTKIRSIIILGIILISTLGIITVNADTLIADFQVSSDGTPVDSPYLIFGKVYRIMVNEIFCASNTVTPRVYADAMYYSSDTQPGGFIWNTYTSLPEGQSFLQINGMDVDWGPYNSVHIYNIEIMGENSVITFQIRDWFDSVYTNNYCHLRVRIYETTTQFWGATPGFWKNHLSDWEGYAPSDGVCAVFSEASAYVSCSDTLLNALDYPGGRGPEGAARILLRAATAALLNAEHPLINYPYSTVEIINMVNAALASGERAVMINLAALIDNYNNIGTPWD